MTDKNKMTDRQKLLDDLYIIINDAIKKAKLERYRGKSHKTRNEYYRSLATLINSYARLARDLEIEEIQEQLEKLEEELGVDLK